MEEGKGLSGANRAVVVQEQKPWAPGLDCHSRMGEYHMHWVAIARIDLLSSNLPLLERMIPFTCV